MLDYREEETADITQESVKLKESLCGEFPFRTALHALTLAACV